ncbi:MAG: class I SAM-dependent methyltransferase [Burkholderiales bacterium]|nr:class I SAM-dependent methyltransferase [Burkholderiales bacterium]
MFEYIECAQCGCLQIRDIPDDLSKYYPENYWVFQEKQISATGQINRLQALLRRRRTKYWLSSKRDMLGRLIASGHEIPSHITWMRKAGIQKLDTAILDVGCGKGDRLLTLAEEGFTNLTGVDPFIEGDITYPNGVKIHKKNLPDMTGRYDLITLHHSYEHMPDQLTTLKKLHELLNNRGCVLIRIPLVSSYAWQKYGAHWAQIDAPRHLYLHTEQSMAILAHAAGFQIRETVYDSALFQFWGSEQYLRDISMYDPRSYLVNPQGSIFTSEEIENFKQQARELNQRGEGDQACFYLQKAL